MADTVPVSFDIPNENLAVNYSYDDFATGTGMVRLYGGKLAISGAVTYALDKNAFLPEEKSYVNSTFTGGPTKTLDYDFDMSPFNTPRIIRGKGILSIPVVATAGGGVTGNAYVVFVIKKVDANSVETDIVSVTSAVKTLTSSAFSGYYSCPVTIPQTSFKRGETLRITMEFWTTAAGGSIYYILGFDPQSRLISWDTLIGGSRVIQLSAGESSFEALIPFKIDT